ncbi:MAG: hypothetical protein NTX50_03810 [Candidatus Sumerlaeota bacterium]|nr:hypothetical protein [Candidatus Sumerlaeota bacterium]
MILLRTPGIEDRFHQALAVLGLASFLLFLTPDSVGGAVAAQPVRQTILLLNSFSSKTSGLVLEADYDYCIYTPRLRPFSANAKHSPFNSFLAENKFDVIIVTEGILNNPNYRNDPEWTEFAKNYNKFGFVRMDVPTVRTQYLLVREEMARRSGKPYYIPVKENQPGQPGIDAGAPPVP